MGGVPHHAFVLVELRPFADRNRPRPIGSGRTISRPLIVALITDLINVHANDTVLDIGTRLGYQPAILAELAREVYRIEINEDFAREAESWPARLTKYSIEGR
jgi:protein-L-isoaspartate(D-aspartate) O-methyltransferase